MRLIGIFLVLIGIAMIATGGFSFKQKKKIVDTDLIDVSTKETKTVAWPWFAGGIAIVGGIVILLFSNHPGNHKGSANSILID